MERKRSAPGETRRARRGGLAWHEWAAVALWLGAIAFCIQFALASGAEMEPHAAVMGWMLVALLAGGGLSVLAASHLNRQRED